MTTLTFLSRFRLAAALVVAIAGLLPSASPAAPVRTPNVEAELVAEKTALVPGQVTTVALRLSMRDGWHTYWRYPGDTGLPTTLDWKLPDGLAAGPIQWPAPLALPVGPLMNYGYEGEVLLLADVAVPTAATAGTPATLRARADWLVCRETCIPEGADLELALPVAGSADRDAKWGGKIAATRESLPRPLAGWHATATGQGAAIELRLVPAAGTGDPGKLRFFPIEDGRIEPSRPQPLKKDGSEYKLTLPVSSALAPGFTRLAGVLTSTGTLGAGAPVRAAAIDVPLEGSVVAGPKPVAAEAPVLNLAEGGASSAIGSLAVAAAFALVGGLILNLMPCVFPVLSLKVLGFVEHHDAKRTMHREAIAFAAGVVLTFVVLGLSLAALRAAGEQLGWGFQLQSPAVVTALALLFFVLALNLSGVFEFGLLLPSGAANWTAKNRTVDAFGSGVLAVVIASPCTAPFMGAALGYALSQSTLATLAVFVALGVGMALPYVLLAWFPGWRRRLPRPGAWMARLKQFLAFPLYATVAWLAWVLGAQLDNDAVLRLAIALVLVALALWAWRAFRGGGSKGFGALAVVGGLATLAVVGPLVLTSPASEADARTASQSTGDGEWQPFSPERVAELTGAGRPVFVDFTAAWCVTCQVNEKLVLSREDVRAAFATRNVAMVRADWTRRDPVITEALAALGRNGVPVYVLHRPGKPPMLLSEVLQRKAVLDALSTLDAAPIAAGGS